MYVTYIYHVNCNTVLSKFHSTQVTEDARNESRLQSSLVCILRKTYRREGFQWKRINRSQDFTMVIAC